MTRSTQSREPGEPGRARFHDDGPGLAFHKDATARAQHPGPVGRDNRVVTELDTIAAGGCWCGKPTGHLWPSGQPHPRPAVPVTPGDEVLRVLADPMAALQARRRAALDAIAVRAIAARCGILMTTSFTLEGDTLRYQVTAQLIPDWPMGRFEEKVLGPSLPRAVVD